VTRSLRERLYSRLVPDPQTGCLLWTGSILRDGYGQISRGGRGSQNARVHRVAWELANGPVPDGLQLDHLCRVRHCANIAHLEAVTQRENILRSSITFASINAAKTHCDNGHEFTEANTYRPPDSRSRQCRECNRDTVRRYYRRWKARAEAGRAAREQERELAS
jgi:HNH endonuclease